VKYYPRGEKELRGPFHQFSSGDTIEWFEKHGVELKLKTTDGCFRQFLNEAAHENTVP
jgi:predicted flavoprotein YhiN